jgi:clan AA aspartic protease (TIGR02281 family)
MAALSWRRAVARHRRRRRARYSAVCFANRRPWMQIVASSTSSKLCGATKLFIVEFVEEAWAVAKLLIIRAVLAFALTAGPATAALADDRPAGQIVAIEPHDGAFVIPVVLNNVMTVKFIVDSGSADVSIPEDVASTLMRSGTMTGADLLGSKTYMLADGSLVPSKIYRMASLRIGEMVMQNVTVRISTAKSSLLLGQSFLSRLKSWSMDNARQVMIIN